MRLVGLSKEMWEGKEEEETGNRRISMDKWRKTKIQVCGIV